jgi:hypothetical protein
MGTGCENAASPDNHSMRKALGYQIGGFFLINRRYGPTFLGDGGDI